MSNELTDGARHWLEDAADELYKTNPNALTVKAQREAAARIANKARPMLAAMIVTMSLGSVAIVVIGLVLGVLILFGAL